MDIEQNRGKLDPITDRELEILHLLENGASNNDIAKALYISLDTVKWYNKQLYSKLGVHSRKEAVARARGLRILPTA